MWSRGTGSTTGLWLGAATLTAMMCVAGGPARAQPAPELHLERFTPATGPDGYFGVEATRTPGPGRFNLLFVTSYEGTPLTLPSGTQSDLTRVRARLAAFLGGEVGLGGRLALGAVLPAYPYQRLSFAPSVNADEHPSFALGDARLHARYRLIGESSSAADAPKDGPGLALSASAALPTHSGERALSGESSVRTELLALADFQLLGAGVAANLGWRHRFDGVAIARLRSDGATPAEPLRLHDELLFGAALKLPLPPAPIVVAILETRGATDFRSSYATTVELDLGARILLGAFTLSIGGGLGFGSGLGTPDGRVLLGVSFSPLESDGDGDGIDDGDDGCPFLGEDRDGFQDHDGCPDPDNDNDLIPDLDDLCPSDAAEEGKDDDEDGCTDGEPPTKKPA